MYLKYDITQMVLINVSDVWCKVCDKHQAKSQFYCVDLTHISNHDFLDKDQNANIYQEEKYVHFILKHL